MGGDQLTDLNVLDGSFIMRKETWAILCTDSLRGRTLYLSHNVPISSGRIWPLIVSSFTLDLMSCNTSPSPMNLKVPTAWKTNSLDSYPWVLRKTSTECMQYGVHFIPNGYSGRREEENDKSPVVSSLVNLSLQFALNWEAGGFLTNKSPALTLVSTTVVRWTEIQKSGLLPQISESKQEANKHREMP